MYRQTAGVESSTCMLNLVCVLLMYICMFSDPAFDLHLCMLQLSMYYVHVCVPNIYATVFTKLFSIYGKYYVSVYILSIIDIEMLT